MTTPNTQQGGLSDEQIERLRGLPKWNGPSILGAHATAGTDELVRMGLATGGQTDRPFGVPEEDYEPRVWCSVAGDVLIGTIDRLSSQSPGDEKPTGTIFELDMFREKLAREAGVRRRVAKSYHDGDPIFQTMLAWSAQLDEFAAELKTLIDNCQKQYCSQSPEGRKGDGEGGFAPASEVVTPSDDARVAVTKLPRFYVEETSDYGPFGGKVCDREDGRCWPVASMPQSLADHMNHIATPENERDDDRLIAVGHDVIAKFCRMEAHIPLADREKLDPRVNDLIREAGDAVSSLDEALETATRAAANSQSQEPLREGEVVIDGEAVTWAKASDPEQVFVPGFCLPADFPTGPVTVTIQPAHPVQRGGDDG